MSQEAIRVELVGVRIELPTNQPIVLLREVGGARFLPIWIGAGEATAIAFALEGVEPQRPLTHDLFTNAVGALGAQIDLLIDQVDALEEDGVINGGQANSLRAKLKAAQKSAANGRVGPTVNQINAFINEVDALMAAGLLSPEEGERLISLAEEIIQSLS